MTQITFFLAYPHDQLNDVISDLETYLCEPYKYVVALEVSKKSHQETNGQHYHVLVEMDEKKYDAYRKTILTNKYKLCGQAKHGKGRQYGKVKEINNLRMLESYLVKDGNFQYKGYTEQEIKEMVAKSFKKDEKKNDLDGCIEYLQSRQDIIEKLELQPPPVELIYSTILDYYLDNNINKLPTKHTFKFILIKLMQEEDKKTKYKTTSNLRKNLLHYILN